MDKLLEALTKTSLTAEQVEEVSKAVEAMVSEAIKQVEAKKQAEFDAKVEEAYEKVSAEVEEAEAKAHEGYQQAYAIINDLQLRLDTQEREYETKMEEGYQQAYEMLEAEQAKNENIEIEAMREADEKLKNMREFMVEKLDQFLQLQKAEIYDEACRDILNDPKIVEHRVAVEKMAEIMSDYLSLEELSGTSSKKLTEAHNEIEDMKGRLKILEKKNINLSSQKNQLTEALQQREQLLEEAKKTVVEEERKNRMKETETARGRGQRVITETQEEVIPEFENTKKLDENNDENSELVNEMLVLSGLSV